MINSSPNEKRYVILRDDDTNALTPPEFLERLYRPFIDRDLPVNLAAIPEAAPNARRADGRLEEFLRGRADIVSRRLWIGRNRELIRYLQTNPGYHVVQHGFDHSYKEFSRRDRADIVRRLDRGSERLTEAGFPRPETFVAPHDQISRESFAALTRRYRIVSTGWFEWRRVPFRWWPAYILKKARRPPHWRAGRTIFLSHPGCILSRYRNRKDMLDRIRFAIATRRLTVLVTHWWEYFPDGRPDEKFIEILHQVADLLANDPNIRVLSFADLARNKSPGILSR